MADSRAFPASLASKAKGKNAAKPTSAGSPCTAHPGKKRPAAKRVGPPTRIELAALDYAVACLARNQRPESLPNLLRWVDGGVYARAIQDIANAERKRRIDRDGAWVRGAIQWGECLTYARRVVKVWLALYLRNVRRGHRVDRWLRSDCDPSSAWAVSWTRSPRPIWLDTPPHEPGMTTRRRRAAQRAAGRADVPA